MASSGVRRMKMSQQPSGKGLASLAPKKLAKPEQKGSTRKDTRAVKK